MCLTRKLRGSGLEVPLGATGRLTDEGAIETVNVDFSDPAYPHLGVVGATGTGKTTAMQAICFHLARQNRPRDLRFAVVAPENKLARWEPVTNLPHATHGVGDPGEIKQFMKWAAHFATTRKYGWPKWFIVIDDVLALLKMIDMKDALGTLAAQGREPGIHLIIGSQKLGESGAGGSDVTANLRARLLLAAASAQDAAMLAGRSKTGAEALEGSGDALLVRGARQERVAVAMATPDDFFRFRFANLRHIRGLASVRKCCTCRRPTFSIRCVVSSWAIRCPRDRCCGWWSRTLMTLRSCAWPTASPGRRPTRPLSGSTAARTAVSRSG